MSFRIICISFLVLGFAQASAAEVALVMSVHGNISRLDGAAPVPLEAFVKLKDGDRLALESDTRLQLVYFKTGRQETWSGPGRLQLTVQEGRAEDLTAPQVKSLPLVMVKQIARTPALDSQGRGGVTRLRTIASDDAIGKLDATYRELRSAVERDDLGPEMYLLSGLYEMRQLERVEQVLAELQQERPKNPEAALLVSLYKKAVRNVRESKK
ncbi:MAG: hypothetical protein K9K30_15815 [Burkholderiaceae bacterium]|nr:hypothetical protein [Sulfuritalea sp.]MCF8176705.1 hypothetical protein [Burkholderiaceae bacterium]